MPEKTSVLFVCLGNICRSTMAEGIFRHLAQKPEWKDKIGRVDSCGTAAYHTGESPDDRTMATLEENGITDYDHAARRFATADFDKFDYIFAMDRSNLSDLVRLQRGNPDAKARVLLFGEYSGTGKAEVVSDPYYGGDAGFKRAFEQCERFAGNFLKDVAEDDGDDDDNDDDDSDDNDGEEDEVEEEVEDEVGVYRSHRASGRGGRAQSTQHLAKTVD